MKKMKKLFAVILSLAMVLGMSLTAFAAPALETVPTGTVVVNNVNEGSEVIAYQIVTYDLTGKYIQVDGSKPVDLEVPTAEEIKEIAKEIANTAVEGVTPASVENLYAKKVVLTPNQNTYSGTVDAGMWIVLVKSGGSKIYNPMIVSANVKTDGTVQGGSVDANGKFTEGEGSTAIELYAKSSEANVTKEVNKDDMAYEIGDNISFTVTADVPEYSSSYKEVFYQLTDTLAGGLEYNQDSVKVKVNGIEYKTNSPVFSNNNTTMAIQIDSDTVLKAENQGEGKVVVTYTAKLTEEAKKNLENNVNPTTNKVELEYTNNPNKVDDIVKDDDETFHYTFGIDAGVLGGNGEIHQNFIKTEEGKVEIVDGVETKKPGNPLAGAQFEILKEVDGEYVRVTDIRGTDADGNQTEDGTTFSNSEGLTKFVGLDANVQYYLREIAAPVGYSIVDTIVPVMIKAEFEENGKLKDGWSIVVGENTSTGEEKENIYTWENDGTTVVLPPDGEIPAYFENTKLASLPSTGGIGTTIFTIGGCAIMIIAAGLFFASRRKAAK